ncbi:MAG: lipase maturation factor family protein [Candidatus Omnitrophica bacterium]|nr:lipase maturation factor family protein [Candidatus Omnitrophota bacterium]
MPEPPLLIYDGDCGFCRRWIVHWQALTGDRVRYAPYQEVAGQFPQIPLEAFRQSVQLILPDGAVLSGARAVIRSLAVVPGKRWLSWVYGRLPGAAALLEWAYRWIARHRDAAARITQWLWGHHSGPETYEVSGWLFLRLLALAYLAAFGSLWGQLHGLIGAHGILPADRFLHAVQQQLGVLGYWAAPTLYWAAPGDLMLTGLCAAGVGLALWLLATGRCPRPVLIGLWAGYLSLTVIGQEFLSYQWDALLLETGFLAILAATRPRLGHWLLRWLLFRLMFSSGIVKLASSDPAWASLTALTYHYQTQPLPTWIGWYAHHLPRAAHVASCATLFVVELGAPWLIFAPRRPRLWGAAALIGLQLIIGLTGNYAFFNGLAIALILLLVDDASWPPWLRRLLGKRAADISGPFSWGAGVVAAGLMILSLAPMFALGTGRLAGPAALVIAYQLMSPWRLVNGYGLFAIMTTRRPEIIVEGSRDGVTWQAYEFRHKPGDPRRPPRFVAPHQPRLDWQMWFAALETSERAPWVAQLEDHLLHGAPEALRLLATNPFPDAPPRFVRAMLYDYRFTTPAERRASGGWWARELLGPYSPTRARTDR